MPFTQDFFTGRKNNNNGTTYVGEVDRLWYEPITNTIRVSDGVTPGGILVGGVSGQVNSDWDAVSGPAEILHKPTIPTDISQLTDITNLLQTSYTLYPATSTVLGGVKVDGTTVAIDPDTDILSAVNITEYLINQDVGIESAVTFDNILPAFPTSDLGSAEYPWRDLYVSGGSIKIADQDYVTDGVSITNKDGYITFNRGGLVIEHDSGVYDVLTATQSGYLTLVAPAAIAATDAAFNIVGSSTRNQQSRNFSGTMIQVTGQDDTPCRISFDAFGYATSTSTNSYVAIAARAARGTVDAPTQIKANDLLMRLTVQGYNNANSYATTIARFNFIATDDFTTSATGTKLQIQATRSGTTNIRTLVDFDPSGDKPGIYLYPPATGNTGIRFNDDSWQTTAGIPKSYLDSGYTRVAPVDGSGKVPSTYLPTGALIYKGSWNATTNITSPGGYSLSDTTPVGLVAGWEYSVAVGGTIDIGNGTETFVEGDYVIFNGTHWDRIPGPAGSGVISIQFDSGTIKTGSLVTVNSADIIMTLDSLSIPNAKLANSSFQINGQTITLGDTGKTITANTTNTLTLGNYLSGSSFNGSSAVTTNVNASSNNVLGSIVARDGVSGGFTAGEIVADSLEANGTITGSANHGIITVGQLTYSDTNIITTFKSSTAGYNQVVLQNSNAAATASTNLIVSNNLGSASTNYGEFGMNSSFFTGSGSFSLPGAVYLSSASTDLVIGTLANKTIRFVTNSSATDVMSISGAGVVTVANPISGSVTGTSSGISGTQTAKYVYAAPNATNGTASFRALVASDIPTLNQNTTGSAGSVANSLTAGVGISFSSGNTYNGSAAITINNTITQYTDALARAALSQGTGISYSSSTGVITNSDLGSSQNIFKTVAVSGQTSVTAASNTATLNLVGAGGIAITTDNTSKTVTLTGSAYSGLLSYTAGNVTSNNYNLDFSTSAAVVSLNNGATSFTITCSGYTSGKVVKLLVGGLQTNNRVTVTGLTAANSTNNTDHASPGTNGALLTIELVCTDATLGSVFMIIHN